MTESLSPQSLDEALAWAAERPDAAVVAGGTDFMVGEPVERAAVPAVLDLSGVREIRGVRDVENGVEIGATTSFTALRTSERIRSRFPALAAAAGVVGGWQIQNRATLGGNIANASPAGDSLPVLLALDATVIAVGPDGRRSVPYARFHTGYRETALRPGELIGWVFLPTPPAGTHQLFRKVGTREAQAISKVVVAVTGRIDRERLKGVRIAAGSVAPTPVRLEAVEQFLESAAPGDSAASRAGELAAAAVEPIDDVRSTADYRRYVLGRVVRRLVLQLVAEA